MTTEQREAENARWVAVQKKAFTHWVNRQLIKRDDIPQIEDLQPDLANGVRLIGLVEILSNRQLEQKWSRKPAMAAHKITNCVLALQHLKAENVGHLTVSAENFVNNDERELPLILGFCWQLLRKYQGLGGNKNTSYEAGLLEWLRSVLKDYGDINLDDNYKSHSFQDGKVWLGLINEFKRGVIGMLPLFILLLILLFSLFFAFFFFISSSYLLISSSSSPYLRLLLIFAFFSLSSPSSSSSLLLFFLSSSLLLVQILQFLSISLL
jgi:hypothetical protein